MKNQQISEFLTDITGHSKLGNTQTKNPIKLKKTNPRKIPQWM